MQSKILNLLVNKGILLKTFIELKSSKKIKIYYGVDLNLNRRLIFYIDKKTKIYKKSANEILNLSTLIQSEKNKIIKKHILFQNCGISKDAFDILIKNGWNIYEFN